VKMKIGEERAEEGREGEGEGERGIGGAVTGTLLERTRDKG
jgi:hypothetical protein